MCAILTVKKPRCIKNRYTFAECAARVKDAIIVEIAMQHNDGYTESIFSYVNNIPTTEGGTHETGFKSALTKVMNDYCRRTGILKEKDAPLPGEDFREGLTAVVSLKMSSIQFEGQTKTNSAIPKRVRRLKLLLWTS